MGKQQANLGLTNKQKLFVDSYLNCWNATQAAKEAGYKGNLATLGVVGHENLKKPKIAEIISIRLKESAMSADEVLMRLAERARDETDRKTQLKALDLLAKHHSLFSDKLEIMVHSELSSMFDMLEQQLDKETFSKILDILG